MDGITKDSIKMAKQMKQLWPQLTDKEAIDEVKRYTNGKNTAIFTEVEGDTRSEEHTSELQSHA